jgi:hypothetical protein
VSFLSRDRSAPILWGLAAACLISAAGCSGGMLSSEPKKYEGGGPLPEFKGVEEPEKPSPKTNRR